MSLKTGVNKYAATCILFLLFIFHISALYATPVSDNGKLQVSGIQLSNECGNPVQLKGISSMGLQWYGVGSCLDYNTLEYMANTIGIDVFRAAMYVDEGGYLTNPAGFTNQVNQLVDWCGQLGVYVIIDWHILNPGDPNVSISSARTFWENMADTHKGKDHVLYEICNEPNGVSWDTVRTYANDIIPRIRAIDPDTIIIVGTPNWSQLGWDVVNNRLPYSNIMYTFHFYAATHSTGMLTPYINEIPIFCTEWGISEASGDGNIDTNNADNFLNIFNGNTGGPLISWAGWSWCDKNESSAYLSPGNCLNIPPSYTTGGSYVVGKVQENPDNWTACNIVTPTFTQTRDPSLPTYTFTPTPVFEPIRVNAGGPQYTDNSGNVWEADKEYTAGSWGYSGGGGTADNSGTAINNTVDDTLYRTERYGNPSYTFDNIPSGTYEITLKFSENYWTSAGERVFSVQAEGITIVDSLDLAGTVGMNYAYDAAAVVDVTDGQLNITSSAAVDGALFMAIQVIGFAAPTNTPVMTSTMTMTPFHTFTHTPTRTFTLVSSPVLTATHTPYSTLTYTPTRTFTLESSPVLTATHTPHSAATTAPSATCTITVSATERESGELSISAEKAFPNPFVRSNGQPFNVSAYFSGDAHKVELRIYTRSYRCVRTEEFSGFSGRGVRVLSVPADRFEGLGSGIYSYVIVSEDSRGEKVKSTVQKFIILK